MADKYCDHGVYYGSHINQPPVVIATADWGKPQEGDGRPQGWVDGVSAGIPRLPSRASATVSIDFTGATFAAGNTVIIAGATLTAAASGAAVNQFNVSADIPTTVANLVAAINAATAQVSSSVVAGETWQFHQLRNVVFARRNPANTSQLDIMCRAGSSSHNSNSSFRVVQSGITGLANAGPYLFSGGESGCWGYMFGCWNTPMWPAGMKGDIANYATSIGAYGVSGDIPPLAGFVAAGDVVNVRSGKSITTGGINYATNNRLGARGTFDNPTIYKFDDGTIWPEDGNTPVFTLTINIESNRWCDLFSGCNGYNGSANNNNDSTHVKFIAKRYSNGSGGFRITSASPGNVNIISGVSHYFEGIDYDHQLSANDFNFANGSQSSSEVATCKFVSCKISSNTASAVYLGGTTTWQMANTQLIGCELVSRYPNPHPGVISLNSSGNMFSMVELIGCRFTGFVAGSRLIPAQSGGNGSCSAILRNCDLGSVMPQPSLASSVSFGVDSMMAGMYAVMSNDIGTRDFFTDAVAGFSEWNGKKDFPTRAAVLTDGVTKWSMRICPSTQPNRIRANSTYRAPTLAKINSLTTGDRTIVVHMATHTDAAFTKKSLFAQLQYEAADGSLVTLTSRTLTDAPLDSDVATSWGAFDTNGGAQVAYARELATYNKTKIAFMTLPGKPFKQNGQVSLTVEIAKGVANITQGVFICPELEII